MQNISEAARAFKRNERKRVRRAQESVEECYGRRRLQRSSAIITVQDVTVDVEEYNIGSMTEQCSYCNAYFWAKERNSSGKYTKCCHDGKINLPTLMDIPELLQKLLSDNSIEARNYRNHIREYNSALAFASFGAHIKPPPGNGPYCFRIHGQIYHMVSPLYSNDQNNAGYGQLYIFDSTEATNRRIENNTGCLRSVMEQLDGLLRQINPFAASYLQMHQFIQLNPATDVKLVFMEDPSSDLRRYNAPTSKTEVAAIFVGDNGEPPSNRDLCIYPVADSCKTISPMNPCIDPMVYPLLFPQGDCGWHAGMEHVQERRTAKRIRVTQLQYYAYRLAIRSEFSLLHSSGKLFQQFIVDVYVRTEGSRLNYLRLNQKDLRVELYQGLLDALQSEAHSNNVKIGKLIILPSTFQGSPRSMQQNYQDAMAIV
ncbi:uncharacterized protein [Parasteatoda tepidariorum]|uniref:uncharacterized protein n=1 Tax=Parasteatoda tepidariorum TaxID=114398 RepID=UPI0039BC670A